MPLEEAGRVGLDSRVRDKARVVLLPVVVPLSAAIDGVGLVVLEGDEILDLLHPFSSKNKTRKRAVPHSGFMVVFADFASRGKIC